MKLLCTNGDPKLNGPPAEDAAESGGEDGGGRRQEARKVDVRLPGKGNSTSHGARPVHLIITMMKWIRTSRLSIKNFLSPLVRMLLKVAEKMEEECDKKQEPRALLPETGGLINLRLITMNE